MRIYWIRILGIVCFLCLGYKLQNYNLLLNFKQLCMCYVFVFLTIFSPVYLTRILAWKVLISIVVLNVILKLMHSAKFYSHEATHSDSAVRLVVLHVGLLETKKVKYMFSFSVLVRSTGDPLRLQPNLFLDSSHKASWPKLNLNCLFPIKCIAVNWYFVRGNPFHTITMPIDCDNKCKKMKQKYCICFRKHFLSTDGHLLWNVKHIKFLNKCSTKHSIREVPSSSAPHERGVYRRNSHGEGTGSSEL